MRQRLAVVVLLGSLVGCGGPAPAAAGRLPPGPLAIAWERDAYALAKSACTDTTVAARASGSSSFTFDRPGGSFGDGGPVLTWQAAPVACDGLCSRTVTICAGTLAGSWTVNSTVTVGGAQASASASIVVQ